MDKKNIDKNLSLEETIAKMQEFQNKKKEIFKIFLPDSKVFVEVKIPSFLSLIKRGIIPTTLLNSVFNAQKENKLNENNIKEYLSLIEIFIKESLVSPKIITLQERENGVIGILIDEITDNDQQFIFSYMQENIIAEGGQFVSFRK